MTKVIRPLALSVMMILALAACNLGSSNQGLIAQATPPLAQLVKIKLNVKAKPPVPLDTAGQVIEYTYTIKNTGSASAPGTVSVTGATVTCPAVNTVGNQDSSLDPGEALECTSSYTVTQADLDQGSVQSAVVANVDGILSEPVTTTVAIRALELTKTAAPQTYDHTGQSITYTYVIKNAGVGNLGPGQFTVSDVSIGPAVNCGDANTTLAPNATVTCTAAYLIKDADMNAASVTNTATASGGGAPTSAPVTATITKAAATTGNPGPANLPAGTTIQHEVVDGEWLWQIARCYGADPQAVIQANPQLADPAQISPKDILSVPNIGSKGTIYGPPCVASYTVKQGDTWTSIAQQYNADPAVLEIVNGNSMPVGSVLNVPRNSAGGAAK